MVRFLPPLVVAPEEIDAILERFQTAVSAVRGEATRRLEPAAAAL